MRALLKMEDALAAVESAFAAHGRGEAVNPPKLHLPLPGIEGFFGAMPALLAGTAGIKWANSHPQNPVRRQLPAVMGLMILSDPETGYPLAVMDATHLTAVRTGAAGAVAARWLARPGAASVGLVGCGAVAAAMLQALRLCFPIQRLVLYDVSPEALERFQSHSGGVAGTLGEVAACDIVCTLTPSRRPILMREMIPPGTHLNAMGADAPGKQELEPAILADARLFVDDPAQAAESGEVNVPLHAGELRREQIAGTLGEVVAGLKEGRRANEQITVFDSTGLAVQDVAVARLVTEAALREGRGTRIPIVEGSP